MTTIAYKDGVVAYDSRITARDLIRSDSHDKKIEQNGVAFFISGYTCDDDRFISIYFGKETNYKGMDESYAIVVEGDKIWLCGVDEGSGLFRSQIQPDEVYVIGSGTPYAYTAMDMGATAIEAVRMAAKRDVRTGGEIRSFELPKGGIDGNPNQGG